MPLPSFDELEEVSGTPDFESLTPYDEAREKRREALLRETEDVRNQARGSQLAQDIFGVAEHAASQLQNPFRVILNAPRDIGVGLGLISPEVKGGADIPLFEPGETERTFMPEGGTVEKILRTVIPNKFQDKIVEGARETAGELGSGLSTLANITALSSGRPGIVVMGAGGAAHIPETIQHIQEATERGDEKELTKGYLNLGMEALGVVGAARHGGAPVEPARIPQIPDVPGSALEVLQPRTAQPPRGEPVPIERATEAQRAAVRREAGAETAFEPAGPQAPEVPEGPSDPRVGQAQLEGADSIHKILSLFPEMKGNREAAMIIRDQAFPETKGPNASQVSPSAEIHGNVRPQPITGEQAMPAEVSSEGIQPQPAPEQPAGAPAGIPKETPIPVEEPTGSATAPPPAKTTNEPVSFNSLLARADKLKAAGIITGKDMGQLQKTLVEVYRTGDKAMIESVKANLADLESKLPQPPRSKTGLAKDVRARLESGQTGEAGFVNLDILKQVVDYGKTLFSKGIDFAKWSTQMIAELGEKARDYLSKAWSALTETKPVDAITEFSKAVLAPESKLSTETANAAGMKAETLADLDHLLDARRQLGQKMREDLKKTGEAKTDAERETLMNQASLASGRGQIPREAIEVATNIGSGSEAMAQRMGKPLGERPLDWTKNKDVKEWLKNHAQEAGIVLPEDFEAPVGKSGLAKEVRAGRTPQQEAAFFRPGDVIEKLDQWRKALSTRFAASSSRKAMDQLIDAGDTLANNVGREAFNNVRLGATPIQRQAASAIVAAKFDRANLYNLYNKAVTGRHTVAQKAIRYAINNFNLVEPIAQRGKVQFDEQIARENAAGINTEYHEGYLPGIYDQDLWMGSGRPYIIGGKAGGIGGKFKKGKVFDSPFDALENPRFKPKSLDLAELVEHRVRSGEKMVNRLKWGEAMRGVVDATDGKSVVTSLIRRPKASGGFDEVAPIGYEPREVLPGVRIAVHEGYSKLFDALTGRSQITEFEPGGVPIGTIALQGAGAIKHGLLLFDTYHASRIMQKQFFLTGKVGYKKGLSLLEYADADLQRAVHEGEITQEMADFARANRSKAHLIISNGLNVGRIQESLYNSVARSIPIVGTFNKWVFEKMTRGAMVQSALLEFDRVSAANPHLSDVQVARQVARDLNAYFGNLGRQGIFKSQTFQDGARLVALAPQWVESMARSEIGGAKQLIADPILQRRVAVGSLGRGMSGGLLAYLVGTQLINLVTRHQFTFQNPEPGHKLDAWIPDASGNTKGFWLSPFAVVAELTHDMIRYSNSTGSKLEAAARILSNKASPYWRAGKTLLTGKDYRDHQLQGWDRIKESGRALLPVPIGASALTQPVKAGESRLPNAQRQGLATVGVKTEPVVSPRIEAAARLNKNIEALTPKLRKLPLSQRRSAAIKELKELSLADREKAMTKLARQGVFTYR